MPFQLGGFSRFSGGASAWDTIPFVKKKPEGKKDTKNVQYLIFKKFLDFTVDEFWVDIFKKCAGGAPPKGFSYNDGIFRHNRSNKTVIINNNRIPEAMLEVQELMSKEGIRPYIEPTQSDEKYVDQAWRDIKSDKERQNKLHAFYGYLKKKYSLNNDEMDNLKRCISFGFSLNIIDHSKIVMKDGSISDITNLCFKNRSFLLKGDVIKRKSSERANTSNATLKKFHSIISCKNAQTTHS